MRHMKRYTLYIDEDDLYLPFLIVDNEKERESSWLDYEGVTSANIYIDTSITVANKELAIRSESFDSLKELQSYVKNLQLIQEFRK